MANEVQLKMLKQGVEVWNRWRKEHPDEKINLEGVNLRDAALSRANLSRANLRGADLGGATLTEANLCQANLWKVNLWEATLTDANLQEAMLQEATLVRTVLVRTTITGVTLYGTARDDWTLDGVKCDYVYWDAKGTHRTPPDRDFRPGEFEELYKQFPTFDYIFAHGFTALDAVVMSRIVEAINEQHPEFELKLDSFHSRGQPHAKFTVLHKEYVEAAKSQVTTDYESRLAVLEGKQEQMMALFSKLINNPQPQLISGCEQVIIGRTVLTDKRTIHVERDYFGQIKDQAQVTTGDSGQASEITNIDQLTTPEALQAHYNLLCDKLSSLQKALILETDPATKFKLEHQIEETETFRHKVRQKLEELECKADNTNKGKNESRP
jgi:uncharacterized protein YjbI with pentapeptide repeats